MPRERGADRLPRMVERAGPNRIALVTDDDALIRRVLGMALESDGWTVVEADDAEAERAALDALSVGLCVMDRHLPGPSLEARIDDIARRHPDAAVLVLSGDPEPAGRDAVHLTKPVDLTTFRDGVRRAIDAVRTRT